MLTDYIADVSEWKARKMPNFLNIDSEFLDKVVSVIEAKMADETFGVAELAEEIGMSRSNLLRRIQKLTDLSVSVLIRQTRLNKAQQLLKNDDTLNVSEVSYQVGFNSVSYFIKCYRELYGYPPGEETQQIQEEEQGVFTPTARGIPVPVTKEGVRLNLVFSGISLIAIIILTVIYWPAQKTAPEIKEKSIAVLPFQNDSNDSSNVYIINGLMEAILNNLQQIEDLRVISRTSVEKYRDGSKTISEISEELDVNYFIEGSGQKIGDEILLTIQLIEAPKDDHLWSERYNRQTTDIFKLQAEVAKDIAQEIQVYITPEEARRIEKVPTTNLEAYDAYLKGMELINQQTLEGLEEAIPYFEEAIAKDPNFGLAHAFFAMTYYYMDTFKAVKQHTDKINYHADRALFLDVELPQSQIAKGLYYIQTAQYELAAEYFEQALEYNPNSASANNYLSEIYNIFKPDTEKYLRHALRGIQLERTGHDSSVVSFSYLHLANALIQNGFVKEAEKQILQSLAYDSTNIPSQYVYAYVLLAKDLNLERTREMITATLAQDTTRLDVLQELAKVCYFMEDYEAAYQYFDRFAKARIQLGFDIFPNQDLLIGRVYDKNGQDSLANHHYESYRQFVAEDRSQYHHLGMASYHAVMGEVEVAMYHLKQFAELDRYQYWFVLFLEQDDIMISLMDHPDYQQTIDKIKETFWKDHEKMRKLLEAEKLL